MRTRHSDREQLHGPWPGDEAHPALDTLQRAHPGYSIWRSRRADSTPGEYNAQFRGSGVLLTAETAAELQRLLQAAEAE
ncbi:hypothetical protein GCM10027440_05080 [Nocardiopsis coralliicola]